MPIYEYEREDGTVFELIQKASEDPLESCPTTGQKVRRLVSASAFHLKGTGWYKTDYGASSSSGGSSSNGSSPKSSEASSSSSSSSDGGKSDSGSSTSSSSEGGASSGGSKKGCGSGCGCH
jgi:putative FmdB family regulatory protein